MFASVALIGGEIAMITLLGSRIMAARDAAGLPAFVPQPVFGLMEVYFTGLFLIWLYAAMRPRYGPGILTAIKAGFAGWFAIIFLGTLHMIWESLGFPATLLLLVAVVMLPVFLFATVVGAWIYKEQDIR